MYAIGTLLHTSLTFVLLAALSRNTRVYLRDVLDHVTTYVIDSKCSQPLTFNSMLEDVESTKEAIGNLNAIYLAR